MSNVFRLAPATNVPGILSDEALQEQLKQFRDQGNATLRSSPPPTSALEKADRIRTEWVDTPLQRTLRSTAAFAPAPLAGVLNAGGALAGLRPEDPHKAEMRDKAQRIDRRSEGLSNTLGGAVLMGVFNPLGTAVMEGSALDRLGTMSPEQSQAHAEQQLETQKRATDVVRDKVKMREQLRGLTNEQAEQLGLPTAGIDQQTMSELQAKENELDQQRLKASAKELGEAVERAADPELQVKQKWWLNTVRSAYHGMADTITGAIAAPFGYLEVFGSENAETAREWLETADATIDKMLPPDKARSKEFLTELSQGGGSMAAFMTTAVMGSLIGLPGGAAAAIFGVASGSTEGLRDAERFTPEAATKLYSMLLNGALGATEALPVDRMLLRAERATGGLVTRMLHNTAAGSITEFMQELSQAIGHDVIAKWLYDEQREMDPSAWARQALIGGIVGGLAGGATTALRDSGVNVGEIRRGVKAPQLEESLTPEQQESVVQSFLDDTQAQLDALFDGGAAVATQPDVALEVVPETAQAVEADDTLAMRVPPGEGEATEAQTQEVAARVATPDAIAAEVSAREDLRFPADKADEFAKRLERAPVYDYPTTVGKGGTVPAPNEDGNIVLRHWSPAPRAEIDPAQRGTGPLRGEERARLTGEDAVDRSYFGVLSGPDAVEPTAKVKDYAKLTDEEKAAVKKLKGVTAAQVKAALERRYHEQGGRRGYSREPNLGRYQHEVEVKPDDLYNANEDPLGLRAQLDPALTPAQRSTQYERLIRDAGFKGALFESRSLGMTAIIFEKTSPRSIIDEATGASVPSPVNGVDPVAAIASAEVPAADLAPLPGLTGGKPVESVVKAARAYAEAAGLPPRRQAEYVAADPDRGARIAAAYEAMEHNPSDPAVKAAYQAMIDETLAQYQFVKATGLKIEFIEEGQADPYPEGPKQVLADLERGHLWVFPTDQGFGTLTEVSDNPLLAPTDEYVNGRRLLANDVFRIVHDFFGHGIEGSGFGARGEENAWQSHMRLYSEAALPAVTSETRGQNSWVNFGPYGEQNRSNQRETVYADQKTGIMPDWTWKEGVAAEYAFDSGATQTPEFKNWFGDSKVVDAEGNPLVVYHGTDAADFTTFKPGAYFTADRAEASAYTMSGDLRRKEASTGKYRVESGADFAGEVLPYYGTLSDIDDPVVGAVYATDQGVVRFLGSGRWAVFDDVEVDYDGDFDGERITVKSGTFDARGVVDEYEQMLTERYPGGEGGRVYPVYLSIQNPVELSALEGNRLGRRLGATDASIAGEIEKYRAQGYDGIATWSDEGALTGEAIRQYIPFDPAQIKSVSNAGDFDPANPDIMAQTSRGRDALPAEPKRDGRGIKGETNAEQDDLSLSRISQNLVKALDLAVRQGRFTLKGKDILGQYSTRQDTIRVRSWSDLSTIVHEAGHAVEANAGAELQQFIKKNEGLLKGIAKKLYGGYSEDMPEPTKRAEGFAEFFRVYTLNRRFAEKNLATLTQDFDALLEQTTPELRKSLDLIGQQFTAWLQLPSAQVVRNMVVSGLQPDGINATLAEIAEEGFPTWFRNVYTSSVEAIVNRYAQLDKLTAELANLGERSVGSALDVKRAEDPAVLIRLAANSGSRAMVQATDGVMGYKSVTPETRGLREALVRYHGLTPDQSLKAIDPERQKDFAAYIVALRGIDEYRRLAEGKIERPPLNATLADLRITVKEMDSKYGDDFREAAEIVHEYGMGLWKKSFDAGLISRETYRDGLDRQFYAPLQRDMSDKALTVGEISTSAVGQGKSIVKQFRGSDRDVIDPMDILMHKTFALERVIAENDVKLALARLADRAGKAGALVERVPAQRLLGMEYDVRDVARQLTRDPGMTEADAADLMAILESSIEEGNRIALFRSQQATAAGENIVFFWEKGKLAAIQLKDGEIGADIVNTLNGIGRETMPMFLDTVATVSTAFRAAITSWPDFLLVNFIRDQMSAWILTDVGYKPFVTGLRGVGDELRQSEWARQYNAAMGMMGGMNVATLHEARINRDIATLRRKGYLARAFQGSGFKGAVQGLSRVVELTETGTRLGVFKKAYDRGKADGLSDWEASVEASYIATDMANFGLNGSRMLAWRRTVPFLNAQLQGLYKMMRTLGGDEARRRKGLNFALRAFFKDVNGLELSRVERQAVVTGRKAWVKMASLGFLGALLHFIFEDDPDYQDASEYMRATGWVIPTGDGQVFYIPKPYELAIVSNIVERAFESASGDKEAKKRLLRGFGMTLVPPMSSPAANIMTEQLANYQFFSESEIVPDHMRALAPELQYNHFTSEFAKDLGAITGFSPMRIDHIMGGLGASAYRDIMFAYNQTDPNRPQSDIEDWPVTRRFFRDARRGSTSSRDFWTFASTVNGSLRGAEVSYRRLVDEGRDMAAQEFLNEQDAEHKAYALLNTHFKAEAKKLNPMYRVRQISTIVSGLRREMLSPLGVENTFSPASDPIKLTAREKAEVDELLSEYARREVRNTMIYQSAAGWANKKPLPTRQTLDLMISTQPALAEELERRISQAKIYDEEIVRDYWPEVRDRLLTDGEEAFLNDAVSIAKAMTR